MKRAALEALLSSENAAMRAVLEDAARVGKRSTPVHIHGEPGTGKEVLARFIHQSSHPNGGAPFVEIALGGRPEELLRNELFGREPIPRERLPLVPGALAQATGGTLFLEDVDELPAKLQLELLGVLKTGLFRRSGAFRDLPFDARLVVTTSSDISQAVKKGTFRSDLFHRLDVFRLFVPPLRERREDILPLANSFIDRIARQWVRPLPELSPEAEAALLAHGFPGNVRELQNVIESALIREAGPSIGAAALDLKTPAAPREGVFFAVELHDNRPPSLAEVERQYIERVMEFSLGNKSEAARVLAVSYPTVSRKLTEWGK